ncbi:hypothetical protein DICA3_B13740 [Diutina catenulata]
MNTPAVPSPLANVVSGKGKDSGTSEESDAIEKLKDFELLPTLYNLLQDLESGHIKAKDFDNSAGSLRLKLGIIRQYLSQIEGIGETVKLRESRISSLHLKNREKGQILANLKERIAKGAPHAQSKPGGDDVEMAE